MIGVHKSIHLNNLVILSAAKVISFSQLCRLLSPAAKEASVLKCVQQYAVLVQGCWVVKR